MSDPKKPTNQLESPGTVHSVTIKFKTAYEAETVGNILAAIVGKQYGTRSIPKGISIEDYVNYREACKSVCDTIVTYSQPGMFDN